MDDEKAEQDHLRSDREDVNQQNHTQAESDQAECDQVESDQVHVEAPEQTLLSIIRLVCQSRQRNRLVVLGSDESLSDNQIFDRLTEGGRVAAFEISTSLQFWVAEKNCWASEYCRGLLDRDDFSDRTLDAVRVWGTEVVPQLDELDFGPVHRQYVDRLIREWGGVLDRLDAYEHHRIPAALLYSVCERDSQLLELIGKPPTGWPSRKFVGLERLLGQIEFSVYSVYGQLFIRTKDVVATRPDWALLIGTEYELVRPYPDQLVAWQEYNQVIQACWDDQLVLCWLDRLPYLYRTVDCLMPYVSSDPQRRAVTQCLHEIEISIRGSAVGRMAPDVNDPAQFRLITDLNRLQTLLFSAMRQEAIERSLLA